MEESLLIGKTVIFSINREQENQGLVLDKIVMIQTNETKDKTHLITGYLIEGKDKKIYDVAYWRIKSIIEEN